MDWGWALGGLEVLLFSRVRVVVDMEENNSTELEEGEAFYCNEGECDNNIDLDISLSYIVRAWLFLLLSRRWSL